MTGAAPALIIAPKSRVDRITDRSIREDDRKNRQGRRRRPTKADVDKYDALIARLTKVHQAAFEPIDWDEIVETGPVAPSVARDAVSQAARRKLTQYRPSLMDSLLGREQEVRRALTAKVLEAGKADAALYAEAKAYAEEHNRLLRLAPDVRAMKPGAIAAAVKGRDGLAELRDVLEGMALDVVGARLVVRIDLMEFDALPDEAAVASAVGPSFAKLSPVERSELQLANACSAALRAAVEVLEVAPADTVELLARALRPSGLSEADMDPVLYLKIPRAALKKLDLRKLDAAPIATAFAARIDWAAQRGLAPIRVDDLGLGVVGQRAAAA